ncbi:hypothetical protein [Nitrosomonas marina]|uniref:Uncharacterized protein n=1 Tax=Nitrosomonas marina TaxID=917 RepID=A0A1H8FN60_9PROT|nr:hypothetical protein [Nitrosomonas marina]SEN33251.1 hypothetical protein SAMN05216325_1148 [Nitrosomonas marina]
MRVAGQVLIDSDVDTFHDATLYVYAEDAGMLDESAVPLGVERIDHVSHRKGETSALPFVVDFTVKNLHSDTIVRAHISMSKTPEIRRGDWVTVQAFAVDMSSRHDNMLLQLQKVT